MLPWTCALPSFTESTVLQSKEGTFTPICEVTVAIPATLCYVQHVVILASSLANLPEYIFKCRKFKII